MIDNVNCQWSDHSAVLVKWSGIAFPKYSGVTVSSKAEYVIISE